MMGLAQSIVGILEKKEKQLPVTKETDGFSSIRYELPDDESIIIRWRPEAKKRVSFRIGSNGNDSQLADPAEICIPFLDGKKQNKIVIFNIEPGLRFLYGKAREFKDIEGVCFYQDGFFTQGAVLLSCANSYTGDLAFVVSPE